MQQKLFVSDPTDALILSVAIKPRPRQLEGAHNVSLHVPISVTTRASREFWAAGLETEYEFDAIQMILARFPSDVNISVSLSDVDNPSLARYKSVFKNINTDLELHK